ncbi:hypothetical protein [Ferrimicrobium sp.]|uniref:hypothetical protein n=1 Tax=Ferrimicrobium sp. TaxID=2926050 RepID=UPI00260DE691|nr:hypothetical protein [Ferrimicrobium sp.]
MGEDLDGISTAASDTTVADATVGAPAFRLVVTGNGRILTANDDTVIRLAH